jgi:hypothetical protein
MLLTSIEEFKIYLEQDCQTKVWIPQSQMAYNELRRTTNVKESWKILLDATLYKTRRKG